MPADRQAAAVLSEAAFQLYNLGRNDLALSVAELAVRTDGGFGAARSVLAGVLDSRGDFPAALAEWTKAARLMPNAPQQVLNHALALLGQGDWAAGLPLYEQRLAVGNWTSVATQASLPVAAEKALRPGIDLVGQRVLLLAEQGMGDTIWALRFLPRLAAVGALPAVAVPASFAPLVQRCVLPPEIVAPAADLPRARIDLRVASRSYDLFAPLMSLPWVLGIRPRIEDRGVVPYIVPDPAAIAAYRQAFRQALPRADRLIGIVWRANPAGSASQLRSIPVDALAPIAARPGLGFINLQGGATEGRSEITAVLPAVHDPLAAHNGNPPLDALAAMVAATDVLVTADTMAAHLAGAVGHPAIVLMPTPPAPMFYWGHTSEASLWYPSLRLARQTRFQDWSGPIAQAAAWLHEPGAAP